MMKIEEKSDLPPEYYKQFEEDIIKYVRSNLRYVRSKGRSKPKLREYVIDPKTDERICVFDDKHKDIVRTGHIASQNLKMRWWCWTCKKYFSAYEYKREADIVDKVVQMVQQEREREKR